MRNRGFLFVAVAVLVSLTIGLAGCRADKAPKEPSMLVPRPGAEGLFNLTVVRTVGNHSYVPLNINRSPNECESDVLAALDVFENAHPELEMLSVTIDGDYMSSHGSGDHTYGLLLTHRPKQAPVVATALQVLPTTSSIGGGGKPMAVLGAERSRKKDPPQQESVDPCSIRRRGPN